MWLEPGYPEHATMGSTSARGVIIWSHGRAEVEEDYQAELPAYLMAFRDAGWDVLRFNRKRAGDVLETGSQTLAEMAANLKAQGYGQVVLAGQSFGAFLALHTAGSSDAIDAVIATAPAAFGSFTDYHVSWRENARRFYPLLRGVRKARVALFLFHNDDYDPGGRADVAETILVERGIEHLVIDQPAYLVGHGAGNTGLFARRFGDCLVRFAERGRRAEDPTCERRWGEMPSAQLPLGDLPGTTATRATPAATTSDGGATTETAAERFLGVWYGFYENGREVVLSVQKIEGDVVYAEYIIGPGLWPEQTMQRYRRIGHIEGKELVFDETFRRSILRYELRPDGKLEAGWSSKDVTSRLDTVMLRIN